MRALTAVMYREGKIRATNVTFIFWDLFYPLSNLLVFGVGLAHLMGPVPGLTIDYNEFFLAGVLGMSSFGIAANTSWSFFLDRDNGIFYEMLTYPLTRAQYLIGKVLFNVAVAVTQTLITISLAQWLLDVDVRPAAFPLAVAAMAVGTAGWFFFYAIFALTIRRNDAFNAVTSIFYVVFLFASSMFYPLDLLPAVFRWVGLSNPITWQVDVLRYVTVGVGGEIVAYESAGFVLFTVVSFALAVRTLNRQE